MRAVLLALALTLVSTGVSAQARIGISWADGNDLNAACNSENTYDQGFCLGFAIAIAATATAVAPKACIPTGVKRSQLRDILVKYLDDHPERRHKSAEFLAIEAFVRAFPCLQ